MFAEVHSTEATTGQYLWFLLPLLLILILITTIIVVLYWRSKRLPPPPNKIDEAIKTHRTFLEDHMDPDFGLLDKLLANETLSSREISDVKDKSPYFKRNSQLLDYIWDKRQGDRLIESLRDTEQIHIVNYLNENGERNPECGEEWPLTKKEISILDTNQGRFIELLELDDLLSRLYSSKVVNNRQRVFISEEPHRKTEALLDILRRRSLRDYQQTISCLNLSKQSHIAKIFTSGGVVLKVHTHLDGSSEIVTPAEDEISTTIANVLSDKSIAESSKILKLAQFKLIAAKQGGSVVLYIWCETVEELLSLHELLNNGQLKDSAEQLFNKLLTHSKKITLKDITLDEEEFVRMQKYFTEPDETEENQKQEPDETEENQKQEPDETEEKQKQETEICYEEDPVLVKTIRTKAAEEFETGISGLAIADNVLFITTFHSNVIEVYDLKSLALSDRWTLNDAENPWDLGYCSRNKCLYVMDANLNYILKVDLNGKLIGKFPTGKGYGCISVTYDCNILMADYEGNKITEYTSEGQIVLEIDLSASSSEGFLHPGHAIKLRDGRYLMSHGEGKDPLQRVCVVDRSGNIQMSFVVQEGSTSDRLFAPIYLAIDSNGSIFVTDRDKSRVLLLSSGLEFKREIISTKKGIHNPERIAFDQANGRLLLAHYDESLTECRVSIFKIL